MCPRRKPPRKFAGLVERNNRIGNLIVEEAFNLWTDGKVGAYVRFVVDGQRFGFHPETDIAAREVRLGDDVYVCPDCGAETPAKADDSGIAALNSRHPERSEGLSSFRAIATEERTTSLRVDALLKPQNKERSFVLRTNRDDGATGRHHGPSG